MTLSTTGDVCRIYHLLLEETVDEVLLDSRCQKTVCGKRWLSRFMSRSSDKERLIIHLEASSDNYRFCDDKQKKALWCVTFLCIFIGKRVNVKTYANYSAIWLVQSRYSMKACGVEINMTVCLRAASTGHYTPPLFFDEPHCGSHTLSGVAFISSTKKEKPAREDTRTSCPRKRNVWCKSHRRRHDFNDASSPHGSTGSVASRQLQAHGERHLSNRWSHESYVQC